MADSMAVTAIYCLPWLMTGYSGWCNCCEEIWGNCICCREMCWLHENSDAVTTCSDAVTTCSDAVTSCCREVWCNNLMQRNVLGAWELWCNTHFMRFVVLWCRNHSVGPLRSSTQRLQRMIAKKQGAALLFDSNRRLHYTSSPHGNIIAYLLSG